MVCPMAPIVCDLCRRHQGSDVHDLRKAAATHHQIWQEHERERIEGLTETYEAKLRERDAELETLRQELDERPVHVVEKWVDADVLEEAHEFARRAYSSREHAFRQLCLVHMNHHELRGERCSCGRSIAACDVVGVVEGLQSPLTLGAGSGGARREGPAPWPSLRVRPEVGAQGSRG